MTDNRNDLCIRILNEADDPDRFDNYADDDMALRYVRELHDERDRLREIESAVRDMLERFSPPPPHLPGEQRLRELLAAGEHERVPVTNEQETT